MHGNTLEEVIGTATATRWAWRTPTRKESRPDANGRVPLAVRRDDLRSVCIGWVYCERNHLLFMAWQEQRKDEGGEWREVDRFPRLEDVRLDERGRWRRCDYCIREDSNEWKYMAPPELRALVADRVRD